MKASENLLTSTVGNYYIKGMAVYFHTRPEQLEYFLASFCKGPQAEVLTVSPLGLEIDVLAFAPPLSDQNAFRSRCFVFH